MQNDFKTLRWDDIQCLWIGNVATSIQLKHKQTGILKTGYYGFSWTTFFFGAFPSLFRQDFITFLGCFVISAIIGVATFGIGALFVGIIWAFMYNKYYTRKLIEKGYEFNDTPENTSAASAALGISRS